MRTIVVLLSTLLPAVALADYQLITVSLEHTNEQGEYLRIDHERFISQSDCRKRGERNIELMRSIGGRGGYLCVPLK